MGRSAPNKDLLKILKTMFVLIMVLLPFHGLITTWLGSNFGDLLVWRAWKEILLVPIIAGTAWLFWQDKSLSRTFWQRTINKVIVVFAIWLVLVTLLMNHDKQSVLLGLTIQLRLFVIFIVAQVLAYYHEFTRRQLFMIVLIPAAGVVGFGLLQIFALPYDFLRHFGYVKNVSIPPYFTIDEQIGKFRIASTLRGPNPLGVYLILPGIFCIAALRAFKAKLPRNALLLLPVPFLLLLTVLYGSHSRGAWIGFAAALTTWVFLSVSKTWKLALVMFGVFAVLLAGVSTYHFRHTTFVEDVVLHDNPNEGGEVSSNTGHLDSLRSALRDIQDRPVSGCGAGCAGPASARNPQGAKIAENYYLQTAQEGGLIGLSLLLIIFGLVAGALLIPTTDPVRRALLAVFVGVSVASLLAHAWADDTIAYLWWGLAGSVVYNETKGKQHNGKKKKTVSHPAR